MSQRCGIIHTIPGRTRLQLSTITIEQAHFEMKLRNFPGIHAVSYSTITNTVLIYHTYKKLPHKFYKYLEYFIEKNTENTPKVINDSVKKQAKEIGWVLGTYAVEKLFFPLSSMAVITPTSLAILFASRHLIIDGAKSILKPTPDTLTAASLLALIIQRKPTSAFVIYTMSAISETLSEHTMYRTRGFVKEMMEMDAKYAWVVTENGQQLNVAVEQVKKGDKVIIFHGDKIPFDGFITDYEGEVDQSSITGEYLPKHVSMGDYVYGGSLVVDGKIMIEVDKVGDDLAINRMIKLIEDAQDKQASIQTSSERFTEKIVPVSFGLAAITYLLTRDWNRVLNILVIDYVCGVKLATATAISASIGKAARKGILVKGGQTLEMLSKVNTVVFDKTGTLTEGRAMVKEVLTYKGYSEDEVLAIAASAESHFSHPIAGAICNEAKNRSLELLEVDFETMDNLVGRGISVKVDTADILIGSRKLMEAFGVELKTDFKAGVFVAKNQELIGIIEINDRIRPEMNRSINQMRRHGIDEVIMLTGDQARTANKVAKQLSVDKILADAMPQDKADFVKGLKKETSRITMMVGDGINDAPALAFADVGVSLGGKKTDIAMETSDVVINSENPLLLSESVRLSQKTMKTIHQNLMATFAINTTAITLGMLGIFPPIVGAAIHNAATIGVVLNSAKLILPGGEELNVRKTHN